MKISPEQIEEQRTKFEAAFVGTARPSFERWTGENGYLGYKDEKTEAAFFGWMLWQVAPGRPLSQAMCKLIESGQLEDDDADLVPQQEPGQALHCPFCGGSNISDGELLTALPSGAAYVQSQCQDCGAAGPAANLAAREIDYGDVKAIAAWNRRAPAAAPGEKS